MKAWYVLSKYEAVTFLFGFFFCFGEFPSRENNDNSRYKCTQSPVEEEKNYGKKFIR